MIRILALQLIRITIFYQPMDEYVPTTTVQTHRVCGISQVEFIDPPADSKIGERGCVYKFELRCLSWSLVNAMTPLILDTDIHL